MLRVSCELSGFGRGVMAVGLGFLAGGGVGVGLGALVFSSPGGGLGTGGGGGLWFGRR